MPVVTRPARPERKGEMGAGTRYKRAPALRLMIHSEQMIGND